VELGVIKKSGSWFSYGEQRFQGRDKLKELIKGDADFAADIEGQVIAIIKSRNKGDEEESTPAPAAAPKATAPAPEAAPAARAAVKAKLDIAIDDDED